MACPPQPCDYICYSAHYPAPGIQNIKYSSAHNILAVMVEGSKFEYKALTDDDSIRLLILRPSRDIYADYHGSLLHTTLSYCRNDLIENYTALSYVWGHPSKVGRVWLDGCHVDITANLEAALKNIRHDSQPHRIWADALSIDQQNQLERNRQVAMMGDIYSTAAHTIVYLGPSTSSTERVLRAARLDQESAQGCERGGNIRHVMELAAKNILSRPWFTRVWVFQELVLSKDPWVQCGRRRVRWVDLCSMLLYNQNPTPIYIGRHNNPTSKVLEQLHMARTASAVDLAQCLEVQRGLGATNSRDLIYAQMGVASDAKDCLALYPIDYSQSWETIFTNTAVWVLRSRGYRYLLAQHSTSEEMWHFGTRAEPTHLLPSWTPDWRLKYQYTSTILRGWNCSKYLSTKPSWGFDLPGIGAENVDADHLVLYLYTPSIHMLSCISEFTDVVTTLSLVIPDAKISDQYANEYLCEPFLDRFFPKWVEALRIMHPGWRIHDESHELTKEESKTVFTGWATPKHWKTKSSHEIFHVLRDWMEHYMKQDGSAPTQNILVGRRLAVTHRGCFEVVPAGSQIGDVVVWGHEGVSVPIGLVRTRKDFSDDDLNVKIRRTYQSLRHSVSWESPRQIHHCILVGECFFTPPLHSKNPVEMFCMS